MVPRPLHFAWLRGCAAILLILAGGSIHSHGDLISWTNSSGGIFSHPSNWSPNIVPAVSDSVQFALPGAYVLTIDGSATNAAAFFHQGSVTHAIPTGVWWLTNEWRVGEAFGMTSRVTTVSGLLAVTNSNGTAVLSVGRKGASELAILGGNVVTDFLEATNGSRSTLTFARGSLTTLGGTLISNSTIVLLGTTTGSNFVWNVLGGSNSILTGPFDFGGLTLGGGGKAMLNIEGPGTVMTVPGLDSTGGHVLYIRAGAVVRTGRVQWGKGSVATNNLVVISDAGSAWINDDLMFFGMHGGAQTLIITNGGYFRTGGPSPFSGRDLTALNHSGDRIIVTGSNSWFHSDGTANFGITSCSPNCHIDNLILITNGGRFWAQQLTYGSGGTTTGNVIDVADGSLWIGSLSFSVGTLRIGAGTGTIDELNMGGGTNAVIATQGILYVGHQGDLNSGDLRIGSASIASLNGELRLGGWKLGTLIGDIGSVGMIGGRALVTNAMGSAALTVGGAGNGMLRVTGGTIHADIVQVSASAGSSGQLSLDGFQTALYTPSLTLGAAGSTIVSNAALLQINSCSAPASSVAVNNATLEFASETPGIAQQAIIASNAVISFRGVNSAPIELNDPAYLGRIQRLGRTMLQMIQSTNSWLPSLVFRGNDPSTWSQMILNGGECLVQAGSLFIETNAVLAATNTVSTISGEFTNRGQILLHKSILRFLGPATLSGVSDFQGVEGAVLFDGGLHLPAADIVVPEGISIRASAITTEGGRLIINGGGIVPSTNGMVPNGSFVFQNGWVTYLDTPAAPLAIPQGLSPLGPVGLELIRSTNASTISHSFFNGAGGYERLRLGSGSAWQSDQLVVSHGGGMFIGDSSASVTLSSGVFRVQEGGLFRDNTGGPSYVGFRASSSNANATVSGAGSVWLTTNVLSIGPGGSNNRLRVELGAQLLSASGSIGNSGNNSNTVILSGQGSTWFATNGLTLQGNENQLILQTGAVFVGSTILANGTGLMLSLNGPGANAYCSDQVRLSGARPRLQITNGAGLITSNGVLDPGSAVGSLVELSGAASFWQLAGSLTLNTAGSLRTNRVVVRDKAVLITSSLSLTNSIVGLGRAALVIQSGLVFVTNNAGTATFTVNGVLDLNRGLLQADNLTANSVSRASINIRAGTARWNSCDIGLGIPLRIGDGTNLTTLNLLGGSNSCPSGLEIRRHAALAGSGTIIGSVTNCGALRPGRITARGNLVLDTTSQTMFSLVGPPGAPQNSSLVVTGNVSLAGSLGIALTSAMTPINTDTFILVQYGSVSSTFSNVSFGQRLLTMNRLASFRIDNTSSSIIATDFKSEDVDGDGIQDDWALQYFGITPLAPGFEPNALDGDLDGDGLSNRNEFALQTDPNDPFSCFRLNIGRTTQGFAQIRFPYRAGYSYRIATSENLATWEEKSVEELQFGADALAVWTDDANATFSQRFYRLLVQ